MPNDLAERMIRAGEAFNKHVIQGKSLRDIGPEMGYSYETVRQDVAAWKKFLADERTSDLNERRATFEAAVQANISRALAAYELAMKAGKVLAAVGAINAITAMMAHQRAVGGLDEAKEQRVQAEVTYNVRWQEDDDAPALPAHAAKGLPERDF
jgi:hypothetical protein